MYTPLNPSFTFKSGFELDQNYIGMFSWWWHWSIITEQHTYENRTSKVKNKCNKNTALKIKIKIWIANSVVNDEMSHYQPSHLVLHCLRCLIMSHLIWFYTVWDVSLRAISSGSTLFEMSHYEPSHLVLHCLRCLITSHLIWFYTVWDVSLRAISSGSTLFEMSHYEPSHLVLHCLRCLIMSHLIWFYTVC